MQTYLPEGMSIKELIEWIQNLEDDEVTYQQNIAAFNYAVKYLIAFGDLAVEPLIERLHNAHNRWMLWGAIWAIREIGDTRAVDALWSVYRNSTDDLGIQHDALIALSILKDESLFDVLVHLINSENTYTTHAAIIALGNLGDQRAVELLLPFLDKTQDSNLAISALGRLEDSRALKPLISLTANAQYDKLQFIIEALGKIGGLEAVNELETVINAESPPTMHMSQYDRLRCDAVNALVQSNEPSSLRVLKSALSHPKRGVRRHARRALAIMGH